MTLPDGFLHGVESPDRKILRLVEQHRRAFRAMVIALIRGIVRFG